MSYNVRRLSCEDIDRQLDIAARIKELNAKGGKIKKYCVKTFGCQQNEADSEILSSLCEKMGYFECDDESDASLILINTCAVREHAELRALSQAGQYKKLKEKDPELLIGMCGCMVSQPHRREDIKFKYPYVDFTVGTSMIYMLPEIIYNRLNGGKRCFYANDCDGVVAEGLPTKHKRSDKAWVSIMYGCNNFCSYCVVPYVRGRERSREKDKILQEVAQLAASGVRDITLLGQNVNSYGRDLYGSDYDFACLLADCDKIPGDFILRFMTSHPKDASRQLIDTMASCKKVAHNFHLPLQAGSDRILKMMNRSYNCEQYLATLAYMREKIPDITVSSDIIVGFPSESEEDFTATLDMLKKAEFDMIFSFIYSPRKDTPAASYPEQIDEETKSRRFSRLLEVQNEISLKKNLDLLGAELDVLCEGLSKNNDKMYTGRTGGGKIVHFEADESDIGKTLKIKIEKAETFALFGKKI